MRGKSRAEAFRNDRDPNERTKRRAVARLAPTSPPIPIPSGFPLDPMPQPRLTFSDFLETAPGSLLLEWEEAAYARITEDIFGAAAIQIGMPQLDTLASNRIASQWLIEPAGQVFAPKSPREGVIVASPELLPIADESADLVTLPHALDFAQCPQQALREAVRILEPEGRLVLTAFNTLGPWWLRQQSVRLGARPYLPSELLPIPLHRLKDWFSLLGLEIDRGSFGIYAPGFRSMKRLRAWGWLDKAGDRWMPHFSNLILLSAVKRVARPRIVNCTPRSALAGRVAVAGMPAASVAAPGAPIRASAPEPEDTAPNTK